MVQQWERGDHIPGVIYRPLYARVTGLPELELFGAPLPPGPRSRPDPGYARLRRGVDETLTIGAMPPAALDDWESSVLRHAEATRDRPAIALMHDLAADLAELSHALKRQRSAGTVVHLTRTVAQMAGLMCLTLIKLDDRTAFRQWARTARIAAAEARDSDTHAWVLAQEAYGHYYASDFTEAIALAEMSQQVNSRWSGPSWQRHWRPVLKRLSGRRGPRRPAQPSGALRVCSTS
ncbi:hypothetical protein [Actinomadura roseirufa]|uniref:hypothetical protein n=1 Tax=Actinomadura roseirufa TaxID=2094049 RepID=UPI001040F999|nr:hypothetical protein [Actinomadura roseirufa]